LPITILADETFNSPRYNLKIAYPKYFSKMLHQKYAEMLSGAKCPEEGENTPLVNV
jgi:hypothetical protein